MQFVDVPEVGRTPAGHSTLLSLSLGVTPATDKPTLLKRISNKLAVKSLIHRKQPLDSKISTLPLHDFKARGWNATTERWMMPIYPRLDSDLRRVEDPEETAWNLQRVNVAENLPKAKGKQRDPGESMPTLTISRCLHVYEYIPGPAIIEPGEDQEAHEPSSEKPEAITPGLDASSLSSLKTTDPSTEGSLPSASTSDTTSDTHGLAALSTMGAGPSDLTKVE
jgi:hypothetical protein